MNWVVGPTIMSLAVPASATGLMLGALLAPSLVGADGVKTVAVGLGAALLTLPVVGFLTGIVLGAQQVLAGDLRGVAGPFVMALYVPLIFVNVLFVAVPAALAWAAATRHFANARGGLTP